ncbi:hypothetical protein F8M41_025579 [Gigaspora margarita]|uniref:Uncharacterized protein n=1 Tax=Gigaspora margarita TaxID=4874 RepID=A0A8H3XI93_GIGMA|nr:hypothetical protein F8M41_025579 [Gigaspora margarita]
MEFAEVDYTSDTCVTHKSRIEDENSKSFEWYIKSAKDGFATGQFNPGGPYDQNRVSLKNACKSWKKNSNRFLRQSRVEQEYTEMDIGQKKPPEPISSILRFENVPVLKIKEK